MSADAAAPIGLIVDIGGTNARFALLSGDGSINQAQTLACADFDTPPDAFHAYAEAQGLEALPDRIAISIAGPVADGRVDMTNHPWTLDAAALSETLAVSRVDLINDFQAIALGLPDLTARDTVAVRAGDSAPGGPATVLGAGTGLGVSLLVPDGLRRITLATEGGHATVAVRTPAEATVADALRQWFGHVSWERVLSGPGLENIHRGLGGEGIDAAEITARASSGDKNAAAALDMFFSFLGTAASDLALAHGATGGVYLAGGILPRLHTALTASGFADRFVDKGRFGDYLARIPVRLITHPYPAFVGLSYLIRQQASSCN